VVDQFEAKLFGHRRWSFSMSSLRNSMTLPVATSI